MANLTAKFRLIDEMSAKLDNIAQSGRNALSQWERAGSAIDTAFGDAVGNTVQVAHSIDDTSDSIEGFTSASERAASAVDEFSSANKETEEALESVVADADKASDKVEEFGEESEEAGRKSKKFGEESEDALRSIEDLLVSAGIVKGLEAIGEAFVDCVKDAIEFESAITGVYKTVDGTPEQLAAIADEVKDLSLHIPSTTTEIAAVAEAAGQLGIATEDVMAFTEVMINLGEATNLSSDEAASSLAKFANITKMNAAHYENLGSTVVALGNNFATTEADIVAMSTRMASAGSLAGLTEPEILALAAAVSSVGIEADAGGSSMSTLLSKMQLAVETGSDELEQFASVANMTSEEFKRQWGESAVDALYAFIAGLNDTERNGASATAILDEMGITEIRLSNAVKALASNHEGLAGAVDLANRAWEQNTALATEANTRYSTLESKLAMTENAQNNLSIAIGDVFAPTVGAAADVWAGFLNGVTGFVKEHPGVVKALTVITAGIATYTAGVTAYIAVKKIATIVQKNFNAAALANPYVLLAAGIAAVVTAVVLFTDSMNEAEKEMASLTATSRKQAKELEDLEKRYEETAETYGENSYEAWVLRQEVDELSAAYENNKQTAEEYAEQVNSVIEALRTQREEYENTSTKFDDENESTAALIAKLQELGSESELAARNQALIIPIINELNSRYEGLGLTFDSLTGKFNMTADQMQEIAKNEIDVKKREEDWKRYVQTIENIPGAYAELSKAETELANRKAEYDRLYEISDNYVLDHWWQMLLGYTEGLNKASRATFDAKTAMEEQQGVVDSLRAEYDALIQTQKDLETQYGYVEDAVNSNGNAFITYEDAVSSALSSVQTRVEELCTAYDEAYQAARESIDGQIGLFDEIVLEVEQSTEEMIGAWESQINYLTSYAENLKKAMDFGLDESLVEELSDGSQESAAQLDTIISKVEELGGTTDEAKKFVDDFNKKFQEVETAKDNFAGTVADIETDFTETMEALETEIMNGIDALKMPEDAAAAAKATMSAYVQEIIAGGNEAVAAAASAAARVKAALETGYATTAPTGGGWDSYQDAADAGYSNIRTRSEFARGNNSDKATYGTYGAYLDAMYQKYVGGGYASGTDYAAEGWKLVGEHGPEIVEFDGGETVYPADETSRILARISDAQFRTSEATAATVKEERTDEKSDSKTIRLEINGSGAIEVDSTMDEDTVVGILAAHLKPVLAGIVKQEIYEEGDLTYDF